MNTEPTKEQVYAMCAYLRSSDSKAGACMNCPATTDTPYGPGEPGCYGISLETIQFAANLLRLRSPSPGVRRTIRRIKVPADKFEIRWLGDPDVEVVLASDYDALSAVAEPAP